MVQIGKVIQLEQMCFAFVVAQSDEFTLGTEREREWVFQYTRRCAWEVLVDCVGWDVAHLESILLPLRAECQQLT